MFPHRLDKAGTAPSAAKASIRSPADWAQSWIGHYRTRTRLFEMLARFANLKASLQQLRDWLARLRGNDDPTVASMKAQIVSDEQALVALAAVLRDHMNKMEESTNDH